MANIDDVSIPGLSSNIIDGSTSQTNDQLYFVGTGRNYVKRVDSATTAYIKQTGNFYQNTNPVGKDFSDILDGGSSSRSTSQFLAPIVGGVFPTQKTGV